MASNDRSLKTVASLRFAFETPFSGAEVESLSTTRGLIHAYGIFFIACGLTGVPAVLLFAALDYWHRRKQPVAAVSLQSNS